MGLTIPDCYEVWEESLRANWGASFIVAVHEGIILFDTGASGQILLHNISVPLPPTTVRLSRRG